MVGIDILKAPFYPDELEWKPQSVGMSEAGKPWVRALAYITNRAIMDRLDAAVGPEGWRNEFKAAPDSGVLCGLSIKVDGEWITKWDGAPNTDIEAVKGGLSGAMKRAAVQWGIGRYLYDLEENFGTVSDQGIFRAQTKEKKAFRWNPPSLPKWALPGTDEARARGLLPAAEVPPPDAPPPEPPKGRVKQSLNERRASAFGWLATSKDALSVEQFADLTAALKLADTDVKLDAVKADAVSCLKVNRDAGLFVEAFAKLDGVK